MHTGVRNPCSKERGFTRALRDELSTALGATAGQNGTAILSRHACTEPVRARTPHFARLIGALHSMGSVNDPWGTKKGVKAKPLSAKVSIDSLRLRLQHRGH
jgi:hypothetical protein